MNRFLSFQNIEYLTTKTDQYLLIHKCASSSIRTAQKIYDKDQTIETVPSTSKTRWTILRDPYQRFVSGLAYDIFLYDKNVNIQDFVEHLIKKKSLFENIYQYVNNSYIKNGKTSHIIPQCTYTFNQPIDFYVRLPDVNLFLEKNYNALNIEDNKSDLNYIKLVEEVISNYKQRIFDIYSMDYYLIQRVDSSGLFWQWNNGKVF